LPIKDNSTEVIVVAMDIGDGVGEDVETFVSIVSSGLARFKVKTRAPVFPLRLQNPRRRHETIKTNRREIREQRDSTKRRIKEIRRRSL
jgi:hypothetical protein